MAGRSLSYVDPVTIADLQAAVAKWQDVDGASRLLKAGKLCEEAGEVMGAVVKMREGRRTVGDLADELADVLIVAAGLAALADVDLGAAVARRWNADVRHREARAVAPDPDVEGLRAVLADAWWEDCGLGVWSEHPEVAAQARADAHRARDMVDGEAVGE